MMPRKGSSNVERSQTLPVDDIIDALLDARVKDALKQVVRDSILEIIDDKLKPLIESVNTLKTEGARVNNAVKELESENNVLRRRLDDLEAYSRRENLIVYGLKESGFAEAASASASATLSSSQVPPARGSSRSIGRNTTLHGDDGIDLPTESNSNTEKAIIDLANNFLQVPLSTSDISIAHRLSKKNRNSPEPVPVVVKFTNSRARNEFYRARKVLAQSKSGIFINEQLIQRRCECIP